MTVESYKPKTADEISALEIYHRLVEAWNERDAHKFAHLFSGTSYVIGFDGSLMIGQAQIENELKQIFGDHNTGTYKFKVRDIRHIDSHTVLLVAVAGIVAPDDYVIDPEKNALQSMVVAKSANGWHIELFQNTPAQFHGRPEMVEELTQELNELS